jgi:hypothetical protein
MSQARFQKRMREKAKQEKQAAKRERKAERAEAAEVEDEAGSDAPPEATVLEQLAALHARFADDAIDFDEFEERKQELLAQLDV